MIFNFIGNHLADLCPMWLVPQLLASSRSYHTCIAKGEKKKRLDGIVAMSGVLLTSVAIADMLGKLLK